MWCGYSKCLMRVDRVDRVDRVAMPWQCLEVEVRHEVASCIDASNLRIPPRENTSRCADLAHNFCIEVKGRIMETYCIWEYVGNLNCDASINEWSSVWFWHWFQSRFAYNINVKSTSDPLSYKCYHFFSRVVPLAPLSAGMVPKLRIIPLDRDRCIKSHVKLTELEWPKTIKNKQKPSIPGKLAERMTCWTIGMKMHYTNSQNVTKSIFSYYIFEIWRRCLVDCSSNTHGECKNQTAALYVSYVSGNGYKWLWMPVCPRSFEACLIFMQFVTFLIVYSAMSLI